MRARHLGVSIVIAGTAAFAAIPAFAANADAPERQERPAAGGTTSMERSAPPAGTYSGSQEESEQRRREAAYGTERNAAGRDGTARTGDRVNRERLAAWEREQRVITQ